MARGNFGPTLEDFERMGCTPFPQDESSAHR
jgi:hypothetical protein